VKSWHFGVLRSFAAMQLLFAAFTPFKKETSLDSLKCFPNFRNSKNISTQKPDRHQLRKKPAVA
jgi:hypothetical protein